MSFLSLGNSSFSDPYNPTEAVLNSRIGETEKWGTFVENEDKLRGFSFEQDKKEKMRKALDKASGYIDGQNRTAGFAKALGSVGSFAASGGFDGLFSGGGTDTLGTSDLQSFGRSAADIKTLETGGIIDHGWIG
jgi:hypothetical protein